MEAALQEPAFWYLGNHRPRGTLPPTRLGLVFDLVCGRKPAQEDFL